MRTVISFVGASDSGKTTVIERLVPILRDRGHSVATVKHASHGFQMDRPGSDSARHREAGATIVAVVGEGRVAIELPAAGFAAVVARHLGDADVVLAEGFSSEPGPKILVHRRGVEPKELTDHSEVITAVTDEPLGHARELTPDAIDELADIIETEMSRLDHDVTLVVDGEVIPITEFVRDIISASVLAMVTTLKGVSPNPTSVEFVLRQR